MTAQSNITPESIVGDLRYLQLLSRSFPTIADASTEIINLEAILNLPKGTEHFLTDIHGEYEAFQHVLKNASGAVKRKVNEIFGNTLREAEKDVYKRQLKERIIFSTDKDLRFYLMNYIEKKGAMDPKALNQWKFIPEKWTVPAAKRDYEFLFGDSQ